ncbi:hypothetical protein A0U87_22375 [Sphingobium sp. MP9-4]|uniref:trypsin-like serine peptidase n=1 Tax=Sphingobium sp. MP9-4 TaxID=1761936 RepID=UPI00113E63AE|nr:serine protease [Sphingobium sp. MP9-4]TKV41075.1 hypothetical protein A0U87_22375 [Sphingobium sp. MP9-4]
MTDWDAPVPASEVKAAIRVANGAAGAGGSGEVAESSGFTMSSLEAGAMPSLESADGKSAAERLDLLDAALADVEDKDSAAQVVRGAREILERDGEPQDGYTMRQLVALEAVIQTDGSAPSLTVKNGFVDAKAPAVGDWKFALIKFESLIQQVISCVGRLNVPINPGFAGTVFAITPELVVTNRHVLEAIARPDDKGGWKLEWPDDTVIDFTAEFGVPTHADYRVTGVEYFGADPINGTVNFAHLDMAILRMVPVGDPKPIGTVTLEQNPGALYQGQGIYAVGFPAPPMKWFGPGKPPPRFETADVVNSVFDRKLGVKKLAPGRVMQLPGQMPGDEGKKWAIAHGCSTLAGNSGSALVDLDDNGGRVIGLHFAGISREQNYGHHFAALHKIVAKYGASYAQDQ